MAFTVTAGDGGVTILLSGLDRWFNQRSSVVIDYDHIVSVQIEPRDELESLIDSRVSGVGTNIGTMRPDRKRVGVMMGRAVVGRQFWAVPASEPDQALVVIDTNGAADFVRLVVEVDDPQGFADRIAAAISSRSK